MKKLTHAIQKLRWPLGRYRSDSAPIVIGGCGRSGTTLMRVILDTHSMVCCGPESHLFTQRTLPHERKVFQQKLAGKFDLVVEEIADMIGNSSSHAEFIDRFYGRYCGITGKPLWADKTPRNVLHLRYIFMHFPNARFVHMIRDGRDTICSLRTHPRYRIVDGRRVETNIRRPLGGCVDRWLKSVKAGMAFRKDPRYIEVKYEDLISSPENTLKGLMEFLDLPWEDSLLYFSEVKSSSRDFTRFVQNAEATRPIYSSAMGRWAADLSPDEAAYVMKRAGSLLKKLGYIN